MTTIAQKIIETRDSINAGPNNVIFARLDALNEIQLAIQLLSENVGVLTTNQQSTNKSLYNIAKEQAEILALCRGFKTTDVQDFGLLGNSTIFDTSSVNFTFPVSNSTVTKFGVQVLSIDGENEINLVNNASATQTITSANGTQNTFSTHFNDYYFVQSRRTGSLAKSTDPADFEAILRPNAVNPLGQNVEFGVDATTEKGTFNENFVPMNISSIEETSGVKFLTMERPLANGSANTFTTPQLYDALVMKRKSNDGGEDAHTQSFVGVVVCEGLQINTDWLPVGDNAGSYAAASANTFKSVKLDDASFKTRADLFHNSDYSTNTFPVFKSLSNTLFSTSQELPFASDTYPNIEKNPLFPYVSKKADLQPTGLGENDLFCGRYVHIEAGRTLPGSTSFDSGTGTLTFTGGSDNEYRFVVDTASKYFLNVNPLLTLQANGTYLSNTVPNANDPQEKAVDNMGSVVDLVTEVTHDTTNYPVTNTRNMFTTTANSYLPSVSGTVNTYPSFTAPATASNTSLSTSATPATRSFFLTNNGVPTDSSGAQITVSASSNNSDVATHFYYTVTSNANSDVNLTESQVRYSYTHASHNSTHYSSTLTRTTSVIRGPYLGEFLYNQINRWKISDAGHVFANTVTGLESRKNNFDPYFEVSVGGTAIDATSQTSYENFHTRVGDLNTKFLLFQTAHNNFTANAIANTTLQQYKTGTNFLTEFENFKTSATTFEASRTERVTTLTARIGEPTYTNVNPAPQDDSSTKAAKKVSAIPAVTTTVSSSSTQKIGFTPYGRKIFDSVNLLLDFDIGILRSVGEKINNIQFAFDKINQDRNIYETLNNRSKQF